MRLRVFGDEHYARYEDADGYTVIYDETRGLFCYADLAGNRFVSTGVTIDQPPPPGLVRHLQESVAAKKAKIEERELLHHMPGVAAFEEVVRTFGPSQGLLSGRRLSVGEVRGLTILVNFQDVASSTTAADVTEMLNGANYTRNGNICSVREYFLRVSNDKLDYTNRVVGPFTLSRKRQHYINNLLVEEALDLAVAAGLDLSQFDSRNEGIVEHDQPHRLGEASAGSRSISTSRTPTSATSSSSWSRPRAGGPPSTRARAARRTTSSPPTTRTGPGS